MAAQVSGKFHYDVKGISEYPAVGDFVMVDRADNQGKRNDPPRTYTEKYFCTKSGRF